MPAEEFDNNPVDSPSVRVINRIEISEDMTNGQAIEGFKVYVHLPRYKNKRILTYIGETVGNRIICHIPAIRTPKITVEVTRATGEHKIKSIKGYFAG